MSQFSFRAVSALAIGLFSLSTVTSAGDIPEASLTETTLKVDTSDDPGMSMIIHRSFLSQWLKRTNSECGAIRNRMFDADVYGGQCTSSVSDVQLIESPNSARFWIVLNGTTRNQTTSYTKQATIQSRGTYGFTSWKQVQFDGQSFKSWRPRTSFRINHQNVGATTRFDGLPIFGQIANRTALRAANDRTPQVRQNAANQIQRRVIAQFDQRVETRLADVNEILDSKIAVMLDQLQVDRSSVASRSLKDHIIVTVGGAAGELAKAKFDTKSLPSEGIALRVHQSYLNKVIASLPLSGLEIPDTAFEKLQQVQPTGFVSFGGPKFGSLIMGQDSPLSISLHDGTIAVQANVGFRPVFGPELPMHRVVLHVQPKLNGQHLSLEMTIDQLEAIETEETTIFELRLDSFNKMLAAKSPIPPLPLMIPIKKEGEETSDALAVTEFDVENGWMQLALDIAPQQELEVVDASEENSRTISTPGIEVAATGGE